MLKIYDWHAVALAELFKPHLTVTFLSPGGSEEQLSADEARKTFNRDPGTRRRSILIDVSQEMLEATIEKVEELTTHLQLAQMRIAELESASEEANDEDRSALVRNVAINLVGPLMQRYSAQDGEYCIKEAIRLANEFVDMLLPTEEAT